MMSNPGVFDIGEWINSQLGQKTIRKVARRLTGSSEARLLYGIQNEEQYEVLKQELCMFLLEAENICWEMFHQAGIEKISQELGRLFQLHLKDKGRRKDINFGRYLYRRLREVLSQNPDLFHVKKRPGGGKVETYSWKKK